MVVALFTFLIKPGERDEFIKATNAIDLLGNTRKEPGNISYDYYLPADDPNAVACFERWENEEAFSAHMDRDHVVKFQDIKAKYIADSVPLLYKAEPMEFKPPEQKPQRS